MKQQHPSIMQSVVRTYGRRRYGHVRPAQQESIMEHPTKLWNNRNVFNSSPESLEDSFDEFCKRTLLPEETRRKWTNDEEESNALFPPKTQVPWNNRKVFESSADSADDSFDKLVQDVSKRGQKKVLQQQTQSVATHQNRNNRLFKQSNSSDSAEGSFDRLRRSNKKSARHNAVKPQTRSVAARRNKENRVPRQSSHSSSSEESFNGLFSKKENHKRRQAKTAVTKRNAKKRPNNEITTGKASRTARKLNSDSDWSLRSQQHISKILAQTSPKNKRYQTRQRKAKQKDASPPQRPRPPEPDWSEIDDWSMACSPEVDRILSPPDCPPCSVPTPPACPTSVRTPDEELIEHGTQPVNESDSLFDSSLSTHVTSHSSVQGSLYQQFGPNIGAQTSTPYSMADGFCHSVTLRKNRNPLLKPTCSFGTSPIEKAQEKTFNSYCLRSTTRSGIGCAIGFSTQHLHPNTASSSTSVPLLSSELDSGNQARQQLETIKSTLMKLTSASQENPKHSETQPREQSSNVRMATNVPKHAKTISGSLTRSRTQSLFEDKLRFHGVKSPLPHSSGYRSCYSSSTTDEDSSVNQTMSNATEEDQSENAKTRSPASNETSSRVEAVDKTNLGISSDDNVPLSLLKEMLNSEHRKECENNSISACLGKKRTTFISSPQQDNARDLIAHTLEENEPLVAHEERLQFNVSHSPPTCQAAATEPMTMAAENDRNECIDVDKYNSTKLMESPTTAAFLKSQPREQSSNVRMATNVPKRAKTISGSLTRSRTQSLFEDKLRFHGVKAPLPHSSGYRFCYSSSTTDEDSSVSQTISVTAEDQSENAKTGSLASNETSSRVEAVDKTDLGISSDDMPLILLKEMLNSERRKECENNSYSTRLGKKRTAFISSPQQDNAGDLIPQSLEENEPLVAHEERLQFNVSPSTPTCQAAGTEPMTMGAENDGNESVNVDEYNSTKFVESPTTAAFLKICEQLFDSADPSVPASLVPVEDFPHPNNVFRQCQEPFSDSHMPSREAENMYTLSLHNSTEIIPVTAITAVTPESRCMGEVVAECNTSSISQMPSVNFDENKPPSKKEGTLNSLKGSERALIRKNTRDATANSTHSSVFSLSECSIDNNPQNETMENINKSYDVNISQGQFPVVSLERLNLEQVMPFIRTGTTESAQSLTEIDVNEPVAIVKKRLRLSPSNSCLHASPRPGFENRGTSSSTASSYSKSRSKEISKGSSSVSEDDTTSSNGIHSPEKRTLLPLSPSSSMKTFNLIACSSTDKNISPHLLKERIRLSWQAVSDNLHLNLSVAECRPPYLTSLDSTCRSRQNTSLVKKPYVNSTPQTPTVAGVANPLAIDLYGSPSTSFASRRASIFHHKRDMHRRARKSLMVTFSSEFPKAIALTPREAVLQHCNQQVPQPFNDFVSQYKSVFKIGEGSYGEVFNGRSNTNELFAIKVVPIEGEILVNDAKQQTFSEVLPEINISLILSQLKNINANNWTSNFLNLHCVKCVSGLYPSKLLKAWTKYDRQQISENDNPGILNSDQLYIAFVSQNAGVDLESYQCTSASQLYSTFVQVACTLAVAENAVEFEHRDLHWGNILLRQTNDILIDYRMKGDDFQVLSHGIHITIIDFTLSRLNEGTTNVANNLSDDPEIFEGEGDYQFEVYRLMRGHTRDDWCGFYPYTNVLWLHYLLLKLCKNKQLKSVRRADRLYITQLEEFCDKILDYSSASQFVETNLDLLKQ